MSKTVEEYLGAKRSPVLVSIYRDLEKAVCNLDFNYDIECLATDSLSYIKWQVANGNLFAEVHIQPRMNRIDIHIKKPPQAYMHLIGRIDKDSHGWTLSHHVYVTSKEDERYSEIIELLKVMIK